MADPATSTTPRVTRNQAILLSVLGAALLAAILYTPSSEISSTSDATDSARPRRSPTPTKSSGWKPNWPKVSLDQLLAQNPFAPLTISTEPLASNDPKPLVAIETPPADTNSDTDTDTDAKLKSSAEVEVEASAARRKADEALAEFQKHRVKLTLRSGEKLSALIGNRIVHEGEIIDGVRIVSILPTGVLVEAATTPE